MIHYFQTREEWLTARRDYVTASDAANLCGEGRKNLYTYYHEKAGLVEPEPVDADTVQWGNELEQKLSDWAWRKLCDDDDWDVCEDLRPPCLYVNSDFPALAATPDSVIEYNGKRVVGEAKNRAWESWKDGVPLDIQVQCRVQMGCVGTARALVVAQLGGGPPQLIWLDYNQDFIKAIHKAAAEFLGHIKSGNTPAIDETPAARRTLRKLNNKIGLDVVQFGADCMALDAEYQELEAQIKELSKRRDEIQNIIEQAIGKSAAGMLPNAIWTRTPVVKDGFYVEPTSYIQVKRRERKQQ